MLLKKMLFVTTFSTPRNILLQTENTPDLTQCVHLTQCAKLFSKQLQRNFKHLNFRKRVFDCSREN